MNRAYHLPYAIYGVHWKSPTPFTSFTMRTSAARFQSDQPPCQMFLLPATLVLFLAQRGFTQYFRQHFLDTTFKGLYTANAFDMALLIPYFIVLILLASYGLHRYTLVYLYYKKRKNETTAPAQEFADLPRVTIQLPIFNEQFVVDRLLQAISRIEYPRKKLDIQLLDDSTDETINVASGLLEQYASQGLPITYMHRTNRAGFKAGALHE